MTRTATAALLALTLAGCGGTTEASEPANLTDAASTIGCANYQDASADSPLTVEYGTCDLPHGTAQLYRFGTPEAVDTFWTATAAFGAAEDQCATVGLIVVCPGPDDLAAVKAALAS